ncbi:MULTISPECIES: hypothetical protein [Mammaliicoccus]|uniref:Lipoprotein n=1 Tax=Mammaliicoccus fleurettii TaxID=150056 RepID=A0ABS5MM75_9STAP|nr:MULTISPECIES: hypothetical protein [Mammaliicoccus]MBL0847017.1 hypothetical protein [Mammaliicoccus fleurettii]MBS3671741.1 hypothetical protein [Mammaliicoccus fleurettii]MBS3696761.1 hypothetical protein [Mammaliicoccus fleurettii]MBW0765940.1 hypothetical protein [Mammaliicoccus fleurettii]MEB6202160.1 hypothetical protein [Mammaliicoccus fleurettii]
MKKLIILFFSSMLVLAACGQKEDSSSNDNNEENKQDNKQKEDSKKENANKSASNTEEQSTEEVTTDEQQSSEEENKNLNYKNVTDRDTLVKILYGDYTEEQKVIAYNSAVSNDVIPQGNVLEGPASAAYESSLRVESGEEKSIYDELPDDNQPSDEIVDRSNVMDFVEDYEGETLDTDSYTFKEPEHRDDGSWGFAYYTKDGELAGSYIVDEYGMVSKFDEDGIEE